MTIICGSCNEDKWCLYDDDQWICKECFIEEDRGDVHAWNEANNEAKRKRLQKRTGGVALSEVSDFAPPTPARQPQPKKCRYGCGTMIFWDDSIKDRNNKFVESETGMVHNFGRCADKLLHLKTDKLQPPPPSPKKNG